MKKRLLSLLLTVCLLLTLTISPALAYTPQEQYDSMQSIVDFIKAYGLTSSSADDPLKNALLKLFEEDPNAYAALMNAMLSSYDSHSMFLPESSYSQAFPTNGSYVGIGVTLEQYGSDVRIVAVAEGGTAKTAGIQPGDILYQVGNVMISGKKLEDVSPMLRGEKDTRVSLTVKRGGKLYTYSIKRAAVGVPNFSSRPVEDGVYYMNFARFADDATYLSFVFALQEMVELNTRSLILDLRDNPGGDVDMALNIINRLLPVKTAFFGMAARQGDGKKYQSFTSEGKGPALNKIVILSNKGSASASEIIQVSLTDLGYAVSVGETTYGKARAQYHMVFDDGSAAVLTSGELIAPSTADYESIGLKPNYPVSNTTSPHPASVCARVPETRLNFSNCSDDVRKLNEALTSLGYLERKTERVWEFGESTVTALNEFRLDHGMAQARYLDASTAKALNQVLDSFKGQTVIVDKQYEKAVEVAREFAKQPQKYTVDELGNFTNLPDEPVKNEGEPKQ